MLSCSEIARRGYVRFERDHRVHHYLLVVHDNNKNAPSASCRLGRRRYFFVPGDEKKVGVRRPTSPALLLPPPFSTDTMSPPERGEISLSAAAAQGLDVESEASRREMRGSNKRPPLSRWFCSLHRKKREEGEFLFMGENSSGIETSLGKSPHLSTGLSDARLAIFVSSGDLYFRALKGPSGFSLSRFAMNGGRGLSFSRGQEEKRRRNESNCSL